MSNFVSEKKIKLANTRSMRHDEIQVNKNISHIFPKNFIISNILLIESLISTLYDIVYNIIHLDIVYYRINLNLSSMFTVDTAIISDTVAVLRAIKIAKLFSLFCVR